MTPSITLTDTEAGKAEAAFIPPAKSGGYLGFYRDESSVEWIQVFVTSTPNHDYYRTPYPLSETRQEIIDAAAKSLPNGGEVKIVRIDL